MVKRKTHTPEFKAKVALEAIREEMTLAELSKSEPVNATGPNEPANGVHPNQISTWKRAAIDNMATAFTRPKLKTLHGAVCTRDSVKRIRTGHG